MRRFNVEGWYRYNRHGEEKDFNVMTTSQFNIKDAVNCFCMYYSDIYFYKITVEEIE